MRVLVVIVLALSMLTGCKVTPVITNDVQMASYLRHQHVQVMTARGTGSGTVFTADTLRFGKVAFVLTAWHVTRTQDNIFVKRQGEAPDGRPYKPEIAPAEIIVEDIRLDLAVLMVRDQKFVRRFKFSPNLAKSDVRVGERVHHVGSFLGTDGFNSYSHGTVSYLYRSKETHGGEIYLHQMTAAAYPGSSGGGVYNARGEYVGTLVRGYDSTFTLFVPIKYVRTFLRVNGLEFIHNPFVPEGRWDKPAA